MASAEEVVDIDELNHFLLRIGNGLGNDVPVNVAGAATYGIYVTLTLFSLHTMIRRDDWHRRWPTVVQLFVLVAMFVSATFVWGTEVAMEYKRIRIVFVYQELGDLTTRLKLANKIINEQQGRKDIAFAVVYLLGDALIGWRTFILAQRRKWLASILIVLWLGSAGSGFGGYDDARTPYGGLVSWTMSMVFNLVATATIIFITWQHRRLVRAAEFTRKTKVDRVLYILASSGLAYVALGSVRMIGYANPTAQGLHTSVTQTIGIVNMMMTSIVGIYPTLVTVLVQHERSLFATGGASSTFVPGSSRNAAIDTTPSIHFRVKTHAETVTDAHVDLYAESIALSPISPTSVEHRDVKKTGV
ncbi:hypothetical protein BKA62DRAFT_718128 [Auriculariales sp. MPI-PUGE-AT-0066]|nr:hypothetical protein BKA62DRAFT_718128 [Auriculariales sp. MPI-PUGE-AT-0066]